jgi:hypothetical protein
MRAEVVAQPVGRSKRQQKKGHRAQVVLRSAGGLQNFKAAHRNSFHDKHLWMCSGLQQMPGLQRPLPDCTCSPEVGELRRVLRGLHWLEKTQQRPVIRAFLSQESQV